MGRIRFLAAAVAGLVSNQTRAQDFSDTSTGIGDEPTASEPGDHFSDEEKGSCTGNKVLVHSDVGDHRAYFFKDVLASSCRVHYTEFGPVPARTAATLFEEIVATVRHVIIAKPFLYD